MPNELMQHRDDVPKNMPDGLYQVDKWQVTAGFIVVNGCLGRIAPILRKRFAFWKRYAKRIGD